MAGIDTIEIKLPYSEQVKLEMAKGGNKSPRAPSLPECLAALVTIMSHVLHTGLADITGATPQETN